MGSRKKPVVKKHRIIVIGASSGGFEAIRTIIRSLPADFEPTIFIVWHISPEVRGILPHVLNNENTIKASHAQDHEKIEPNHIYIAPPDHHMIIEKGEIRITRGPKENRFRPAIDPLFRSAAFHYDGQVIGVILSGALDDGVAGLWTVKYYNGSAIVQDPNDAAVASMPENAVKQVEVDYILPATEIAEMLVKLSMDDLPEKKVKKDFQTKTEIRIAAENRPLKNGKLVFDEITPYTCPECHGVLSRLHNDKIIRYRCHTGHAYTTKALLDALEEKIEEDLYSAIRGIDETVILLNHIGDHYAEANYPKLAAMYFQEAKRSGRRSEVIRGDILRQERIIIDTPGILPVNNQSTIRQKRNGKKSIKQKTS
jgi:two-component system chemotaxis response regulator CheB